MDASNLAKVFDGPTVIIIIMFITAIASLVTGRVVPKFIYEREKERADKGEDTIEKLTDLLEDYNSQLRALRRGQTDA